MKIFASFALFALVSNSVFAGEVGALDPSISKAPSSFDVAIAEIGASDRWETRSNDFRVVPVESATSRQVRALNKQLDTIHGEMNSELNELIELKVTQSLRY